VSQERLFTNTRGVVRAAGSTGCDVLAESLDDFSVIVVFASVVGSTGDAGVGAAASVEAGACSIFDASVSIFVCLFACLLDSCFLYVSATEQINRNNIAHRLVRYAME